MKKSQAKRGFTILEIIIVLFLLTVLFGVSVYLFVVCLRAWNFGIVRAGIREDMNFAVERVVRSLKTTAQGGLSPYGAVDNTVQFVSLDGNTYVFYLYNPADASFDSNYVASTYDLRKANIFGGWTEIIYDEFESGFGNWTDGGADCIRYTGGTFAHQGSAAIDLQDDTSSSVVSTGDLALSGYSEVKVDFWYQAEGMEANEDFWLQISTNGGSNYTTVQSWVEGTDFLNSTFYEEFVTITGYTLTDQTRIRLRVDASNASDDVYFDEIRVSATTGGAESPAAGEGMLILRDVVSPDAAEPATDITINGNEVTLDLVVKRVWGS